MKILFKNANVYNSNFENCFKLCDVVVCDNIIEYIGNMDSLCGIDRVIDCNENILMPGFVDSHCHGAMSVLRSLKDDTSLHSWLFDNMFPAESKMTKEDMYYGQLLSCLEYIRAGITTVEEMYYNFDYLIKAFEQSKMRARICVGPTLNMEDDNVEEYLESYLKYFTNKEIIKPCAYVHSIYTINENQINTVLNFSAKHNLPRSIHLSETLEEVGDCTVEHNGKTPVQYLEDLGFFDRDCICHHCVHVDKDDLDILASYNVNICTCPSSNIKLASGIAPVFAMQNKKINVCIGTDGPASNNSLDMFKENFLVSTLSKVNIYDPSVVTAQEVLDMSTKNGAKALGFDCGEIAVGKLADIILIDTTKPHFQPKSNLLGNLVYSAKSSDVYLTMINGNIVYENDKFNLDLNYYQLVKKIEEIRKRIEKK